MLTPGDENAHSPAPAPQDQLATAHNTQHISRGGQKESSASHRPADADSTGKHSRPQHSIDQEKQREVPHSASPPMSGNAASALPCAAHLPLAKLLPHTHKAWHSQAPTLSRCCICCRDKTQIETVPPPGIWQRPLTRLPYGPLCPVQYAQVRYMRICAVD